MGQRGGMTALVSIETGTGRFRRYTKYGSGNMTKTHGFWVCDWDKILQGTEALDLVGIEAFRLIGVVL
jgi:hypothetical protein